MTPRRRIAAALQRVVDWLDEKPDFPRLTTSVGGATVKHPPSMADEIEAMRRDQENGLCVHSLLVSNCALCTPTPGSNVELIGKRPRATKRGKRLKAVS